MENIFDGNWEILSLHRQTQTQEWITLKQYDINSLIWKFREEQSVSFPSSSKIYAGSVKEYFRGGLLNITKYTYFPFDQQLYVENSFYKKNILTIIIDDCFYMEQISENEYWLYDMAKITEEPIRYITKLKLRKLT